MFSVRQQRATSAEWLASNRWVRAIAICSGVFALCLEARAAGTPAGTVVENAATVSFEVAGNPSMLTTNLTSFTVLERIDVIVTLQSPQALVAAAETNRALLFTVTNTGNGTETFGLAVDNALTGDDFDPLAAVPPIFFDSDGSGDLNVGDVAYTPGSNDPDLPADGSVAILIVNDIPPAVANGDIGRSGLVATSLTGTGTPGAEFPGAGDAGTDAIVGTSGGQAIAVGEYIVSDVEVVVSKSQSVADQFGGTEPVPGATITYTVTVEVIGSGTATASVFSDPIPEFSSYVPASTTLNGTPLTDAADTDAGEFISSGTPGVIVRLGDVSASDGIQTIAFQVTID